MNQLRRICNHMQQLDKNGSWVELYQDLQLNDISTSSALKYIEETLTEWYLDTNDILVRSLLEETQKLREDY